MVGRVRTSITRGRQTAREISSLRQELLSTAGREPLPIKPSNKNLYGSKTIGLYGGIMLLINNLAGPTVSLMPSLTQEAGWLAAIVAEVVIALLAASCGFMILAAMRAIPGNKDLELRVEYIDVVRFYIPGVWSVLVTFCYIGYLIMTLMACIIQTAQVIDYVFTDTVGYAYGLQLWPTVEVIAGVSTGSNTPFSDDTMVFSFSFLVVAVVCAPFALKNLDDNITLQWIANIGFSFIVVVWLAFFVQKPEFPLGLPAMTSSQFGLINTLFFNFAMATSVPSWANEKLPDVSVPVSFATSLGFVVVVYSAIGIVGGMAFHAYFDTDQDLFSKLNDSGSATLQATVSLYPVLQNFTSIPVFSIMIRYNLLKLALFDKRAATFLAVGMPWVLSVFFYTGSGFQFVSDVGGIVFSLLINNVVPVAVYLKSTWKRNVALTVQRCTSALAAADADLASPAEIGSGLVVAVAFAEGATDECIQHAAKFVLTAKLSGARSWLPTRRHELCGAESVASLCGRGEPQGVLVVPQASLLASISEDGEDILYHSWPNEKKAAMAYDSFVDALKAEAHDIYANALSSSDNPPPDEPEPERSLPGTLMTSLLFADLAFSPNTPPPGQPAPRKSPQLPVVVAGKFHASRHLEVRSAGPVVHSFTF